MSLSNEQWTVSSVELFFLNIEISSALWVHIHAFEFTLRTFLLSRLTGFIETTLSGRETFLSSEDAQEILKAQNRMKNKGLSPNLDLIAQSLGLAFWTKLLAKRYHRPVWLKISPHLANKTMRREEFYKKARTIKSLRNSIAHQEFILKRNLTRDYRFLDELLTILDPFLAREIKIRSRVPILLGNLSASMHKVIQRT